MNAEAHLAAGWILAHLAPREDRSFRRWVTGAAMVCDVDVLSYVGGGYWYSRLHHALGHNIFFCAGFTILAYWVWRRRPATDSSQQRSRTQKLVAFVIIALASHLITDYYLTRFPLEFWWPLTSKGWIHSYRIGLDHPINLFLSYLSFVVFVLMGMMFKRTPIELVSVDLDKRVVNLFRTKPLACHVCQRAANEICSLCGRAVCPRHGRIAKGFRVLCSECSAAGAPESVPSARPGSEHAGRTLPPLD